MSFADSLMEDFLMLATGEMGEAIVYEETGPAGPAASKMISAIVLRGTAATPLELGTVGRRGPEPAEVRISKHPTQGVARPAAGKDHLTLNPGTPLERRCLVSAILGEDPGAWRVYACP